MILVLLLLLFSIKGRLAGCGSELNDFKKLGGVALVARDYGLKPALEITHIPHGS